MASLLDINHYKALRGLTNTERDQAIEAAIPAAEQAILEYTNRDLTTDPTGGTRTYSYEPGAIIQEIDDATTVTAVELNGRLLTEGIDYITGSAPGEPVISWLEIAPQASLPDPLYEVTHVVTDSRRFRPFNTVTVTASYGWPSVPATATQAAVWLVDEMIAPGADTTGHAAEAIADLSYVNRGEEEGTEHPSLPPRVAQILTNLRKVAM